MKLANDRTERRSTAAAIWILRASDIRNGDILSLYSEGAALCQPYALHFVLQNAAGIPQYEFSRAINHTDMRQRPADIRSQRDGPRPRLAFI